MITYTVYQNLKFVSTEMYCLWWSNVLIIRSSPAWCYYDSFNVCVSSFPDVSSSNDDHGFFLEKALILFF